MRCEFDLKLKDVGDLDVRRRRDPRPAVRQVQNPAVDDGQDAAGVCPRQRVQRPALAPAALHLVLRMVVRRQTRLRLSLRSI